ncbi:hypothetical protein [Porphyromonas sp.]|uniref:hypothetical protein n=1 Tax=Porphyromonas sp. TaxID=1924944 RepID=UPI0026DAEF74|nr:hypothetical protein [Porphyromonas sp.]MDO4770822.1 hypothetical protein [Porphyromonas sp.]
MNRVLGLAGLLLGILICGCGTPKRDVVFVVKKTNDAKRLGYHGKIKSYVAGEYQKVMGSYVHRGGYSYEFDKEGRMLMRYKNDEDEGYSQEYSYIGDERGALIMCKVTEDLKDTILTAYNYDGCGNCVRMTDFKIVVADTLRVTVTEMTHDDKNLLVTKEIRHEGNSTKMHECYEYDAMGHCSSTKKYELALNEIPDPQRSPSVLHRYIYDEAGHLIEEKENKGGAESVSMTYKLDNKSKIIEYKKLEVTPAETHETIEEYTYSPEGKRASKSIHKDGILVQQLTYNEHGLLSERRYYDEGGILNELCLYEYDDYNNMSSIKVYHGPWDWQDRKCDAFWDIRIEYYDDDVKTEQ